MNLAAYSTCFATFAGRCRPGGARADFLITGDPNFHTGRAGYDWIRKDEAAEMKLRKDHLAVSSQQPLRYGASCAEGVFRAFLGRFSGAEAVCMAFQRCLGVLTAAAALMRARSPCCSRYNRYPTPKAPSRKRLARMATPKKRSGVYELDRTPTIP